MMTVIRDLHKLSLPVLTVTSKMPEKIFLSAMSGYLSWRTFLCETA